MGWSIVKNENVTKWLNFDSFVLNLWCDECWVDPVEVGPLQSC